LTVIIIIINICAATRIWPEVSGFWALVSGFRI